ncbi:MAG: sigma factor, partial [Microbacteriaceae bacterium]
MAASFVSLRPRLFGIAYRMLGSAVEAEDVLQDAWIKWQATDRSGIRSPAAFLTTMTTRLAINVANSSRMRRETYIGPWLPEPVLTETDPELGAENTEALEIGLLLLMERLTPTERAVYLLHEAFDYPYREIAEVIET